MRKTDLKRTAKAITKKFISIFLDGKVFVRVLMGRKREVEINNEA